MRKQRQISTVKERAQRDGISPRAARHVPGKRGPAGVQHVATMVALMAMQMSEKQRTESFLGSALVFASLFIIFYIFYGQVTLTPTPPPTPTPPWNFNAIDEGAM